MGVWGQQLPEASDISKNQIKWKPDIYFFKKKTPYFFKAYVVKLERSYIDIYGVLGVTAPRSQQHLKESDKMET